jgi:hypothetical protein
MTSGHAVEWIASMIFDITLEVRAAIPAFDRYFKSSQLEGKTVNVKWCLRQEGVLMTTSPTLDYYLVIAGPWLSATLDTHNEAMGDRLRLSLRRAQVAGREPG